MNNPIHQYDREVCFDHLVPAFSDKRGDITNIIDGVLLKHVALITSKKGSIRGNHYHAFQQQYIYIIKGRLISYSTLVSNPKRVHSLPASAGDLLYCPPNVAHAYAFLEDTVFLNLDDDVRNPDTYAEDTIHFEVKM